VKVCSNCGNEFDSNKKNQKYCTPACCRLATNKKIMTKYYQNKKRLGGEKRVCPCGQLLSRYNENDVCFPCFNKKKQDDKGSILEVIRNVAKKTNKTKR
jgi:hypothetical protein